MPLALERSAIHFRAVGPEDEPFLRQLYATTRADELAPVPWTDAEKAAFLDMQFRAQDSYYRAQFERASFHLVELHGEPIGRLYTDRRDDEIRVLDIALLPKYRGQGLGRLLMQELLDEAAAASKAVRIHVERFNPAMRLYDRLGFVQREDQGVYILMEYLPPGATRRAPHLAGAPASLPAIS